MNDPRPKTVLSRLHALSLSNDALVRLAGEGICFNCGTTTRYKNFTSANKLKDTTLLCPHCSIDSIIPVTTHKLIAKLNKVYFDGRGLSKSKSKPRISLKTINLE